MGVCVSSDLGISKVHLRAESPQTQSEYRVDSLCGWQCTSST